MRRIAKSNRGLQRKSSHPFHNLACIVFGQPVPSDSTQKPGVARDTHGCGSIALSCSRKLGHMYHIIKSPNEHAGDPDNDLHAAPVIRYVHLGPSNECLYGSLSAQSITCRMESPNKRRHATHVASSYISCLVPVPFSCLILFDKRLGTAETETDLLSP